MDNRLKIKEKYEFIKNKIGTNVLMKTADLKELKLYYKDIAALVNNGYLIKIKHGYYQVASDSNSTQSEAKTISLLFPDGVITMYSALFYYGYSDYTPRVWDVTVNRNTSKGKFNIDYPFVKPYFMEQKHLRYGVTEAQYEDCVLNIFDRDRLICEVIRNENKIDKEIYTKAIKNYVADPKKSIINLIDYAKRRNMLNKVKMRIEIWI